MIRSLKFKLTLLYLVFFLIVLVTYGAILYFSLHNTLYEDFDNALQAKADKLAKSLGGYKDLQKRKWIISTDYVNIVDPAKKPIVTSKNFGGKLLSQFVKAAPDPRLEKASFKIVSAGKQKFRIINAPLPGDAKGYVLQIGNSLKPLYGIMQARLLYIAASIPLVLSAGGLLGYLFMARALRPIRDIVKAAENISHEDLSARVESTLVDEEFKRLISAFNGMISRLDRSFEHISEFSAHVAHELKTPIAIIRGEAEIALRKERSPEEYARVINVCLEESRRMLRTIEDLFLLARLDFRPEIFKFERTNMREFMDEIYEQSRILASPKEISVEKKFTEEEIFMYADKVHLRRLFFNLVNNAIKFTPRSGRINFSMKKDGGGVNISVSDTGAGIPDEDLPKIFDRFFHVDRTGGEAESSSGLGLSIARSIAKIHDGEILAASRPGKGSAFTVILPIKDL